MRPLIAQVPGVLSTTFAAVPRRAMLRDARCLVQAVAFNPFPVQDLRISEC